MTLDDPFANRQAHACSGIFVPRMQPLENFKNPREMLWLNADTVVADRKQPFAVPLVRTHMDARRRLPMKFDGVANEILEYLRQLDEVAPHGG